MGLTDEWLIEESFPTKRELCPRCNGDRTVVNPSLGAYTESDRLEMGDEWYEFQDNVRAGHYDVMCPECEGLGYVTVLDESKATPDQVRRVEEWMRDLRESYAISEAERRAGA